jgi:hypothetical protein
MLRRTSCLFRQSTFVTQMRYSILPISKCSEEPPVYFTLGDATMTLVEGDLVSKCSEEPLVAMTVPLERPDYRAHYLTSKCPEELPVYFTTIPVIVKPTFVNTQSMSKCSEEPPVYFAILYGQHRRYRRVYSV